MKEYIRQSLLIIIFAVFFLIPIFFHPVQGTNEKSVFQTLLSQSQIACKASPVLPVRLIIPSLNVNANIQNVGVTLKGEMDVPNNTFDVGWFDLGPRPGERGSSVIAGHFDGKNGEAGVFTNLYKLKKGDKLYIKNDRGTSSTFVVREKRTYDTGYANDVFSSSNSAHLNLITCDGLWDGTKKSYTKRLVVFTDILY